MYSSSGITDGMWVGRCALESSGSALRFEIESFQIRVEPMPGHACRGAAEYGCCFVGASRFRGGKSSGLLIDLWVGLVFGWWLALPTSLALLVRATLRWLVAALAWPAHPPTQASIGPLVAPLLRDFKPAGRERSGRPRRRRSSGDRYAPGPTARTGSPAPDTASAAAATRGTP